jgi:hypothetical protein
MKISPRLLIALTLLLLFVGFSLVPPSESPESNNSPTEIVPEQSDTPQSETVPVPCEQSTQEAIEITVNSQTQAFAQDNFELAYSFASPSFRSSVSLDGFVAIIAGSYGPLIESSELRFSDCLANSNGGFALIDVSFLQAGDFVYALRYLMVETSDGWRVDGASDLEVVGEGT